MGVAEKTHGWSTWGQGHAINYEDHGKGWNTDWWYTGGGKKKQVKPRVKI